jgi:hypothetical protein
MLSHHPSIRFHMYPACVRQAPALRRQGRAKKHGEKGVFGECGCSLVTSGGRDDDVCHLLILNSRI